MCLKLKKKGKPKVLSGGFCLRDSKADQRKLKFLHIYYLNVNNYCSAAESDMQNPRGGTSDLPFYFDLKHITSLRHFPSLVPSDSLPHWFQGNFETMFVLNYWLREFLLSHSVVVLN